MPCSPARLLANQANAKRSTGPKTDEGKSRSRANALKHGLTGQGIVASEVDAEEVARRTEQLLLELAPSGPMGRIMVERIARLSVKLDRSAEHETAATEKAVRHAKDDHDDRMQAEVEALFETLADKPATSVRKLLRTPPGIDALVQAWDDLKGELVRGRWTLAHSALANNLTGRRNDEVTLSRISELSSAILGDFRLIGSSEGAGLDDQSRRGWASERLLELIESELEALAECRESLDLEAFEIDREEAGRLALFDASKEATLARRYEAAAERGMFRALREYRQLEAEAAERPEPAQPPDTPPLGSFFPAAENPVEGEPEAPLERSSKENRRPAPLPDPNPERRRRENGTPIATIDRNSPHFVARPPSL